MWHKPQPSHRGHILSLSRAPRAGVLHTPVSADEAAPGVRGKEPVRCVAVHERCAGVAKKEKPFQAVAHVDHAILEALDVQRGLEPAGSKEAVRVVHLGRLRLRLHIGVDRKRARRAAPEVGCPNVGQRVTLAA
eukprot:4228798-Prymnesium_polylepis.1